MTEQHYTAEEIILRMEGAGPTIERWRTQWSDLFNEKVVPGLVWRLQCYELMGRAQFQLTYTPHPMLNCPVCHQRREIRGCGMRFVLGVRRRICSRCAAAHDKAKRRAKL